LAHNERSHLAVIPARIQIVSSWSNLTIITKIVINVLRNRRGSPMRSFLLYAALCTVFLVSTCCADDKRLIAEQENVVVQTEESRAKAEKSAAAWEAHIEKLNSEVLPKDHFSHDVPKTSQIAHKHAIHRMISKSTAKHVKPQAKKHVVQQKADTWHHVTASEVSHVLILFGLLACW
jgi:hypothetical protein